MFLHNVGYYKNFLQSPVTTFLSLVIDEILKSKYTLSTGLLNAVYQIVFMYTCSVSHILPKDTNVKIQIPINTQLIFCITDLHLNPNSLLLYFQGESSDITITEDDRRAYADDKDFQTNAVRGTIEAVVAAESYEACPTHFKKLTSDHICVTCNKAVHEPINQDLCTVLLQCKDSLQELVMFQSVINMLKDRHGISDILDFEGLEDNFVIKDNKIAYVI